MPEKSPPAPKEQLLAFFADLERELERIEFFRPHEKRGTMTVNMRNIFTRMQPSQQDIRTLHGVMMALVEGRKGPARGGLLDGAEADMLRNLLAQHGKAEIARTDSPVRGLARLLRRNPTDAERALWMTMTGDRRFVALGFKRQTPIGPHVADFVSFPLRIVIDVTPDTEDAAAADMRRQKLAWLRERNYRIIDVGAAEVVEGCRLRCWSASLPCFRASHSSQRTDRNYLSAFNCAAVPARRNAVSLPTVRKRESRFRLGDGALGVAAIQARNFLVPVAGLQHLFQRRFDLGRMRIHRGAVRQAAGQVGRADEQQVDPRHRRDGVEIVDRRPGLDHREGDRRRHWRRRYRASGPARRASIAGAMRADRAFADRRIFRDLHEGARFGLAVDHRRDDAFGAEIEHAADQRILPQRHAHDRRRARQMDAARPPARRRPRPTCRAAYRASTAEKPSRAIASQTSGSGRPHQAE